MKSFNLEIFINYLEYICVNIHQLESKCRMKKILVTAARDFDVLISVIIHF